MGKKRVSNSEWESDYLCKIKVQAELTSLESRRIPLVVEALNMD
jgi:hypothetical protein